MEPTQAAESPEAAGVLAENHRRFLAFLERRVGSRDVAEHGRVDCACGR